MLSLALEHAPGFSVETAELARPGPSYTVDTLEELQRREPGAEFILLLGADAALELPTWHRASRIAELARIAIFARPGTVLPLPTQLPVTIEVPAIDISATQIRDRVRQGRSVRYWVPDRVAEYISAHRLYLDPE